MNRSSEIVAPLLDRGEQIAHRGFAVAFDLLQLDLACCAPGSVKMSAGSFTQPCSKNNSICFSPSPSMSKARRETNCFRCSIFWNGQANSPVQRARAPSSPVAVSSRTTSVCSWHGHFFGKWYGFGVLRPLVDHHVDHLRDDVAGALDDDGVADADIAALAHLLAVAADALDVVLVVQRDVLHDDAADA